jgi:ACS family hexuronate transporter-like MFS transporter
MLIAKIVGYLLQWTGSYEVPFLIAGAAYLLALGAIQLFAPKLEQARLNAEVSL